MRPSTRRALRRWFWLTLGATLLVILLSNRWVINSTDAYVFTSETLIPSNDAGVVLGTSPYVTSGKASREFQGRVKAAAELYRLGKVRHLIVSGANPDARYNEPRAMWRELVKAGVPETAITMDFAGFRTLDSIVRAHAIFGFSSFTVITQRYHSYRAVFLGKKLGMSVVAYCAPATADGSLGLRHPPREIFARVKAVLDVFLLNTRPKFLGNPENIQMPEAQPDAAPAVAPEAEPT